jgi:hypothetical protein
VVQAVKRNYWDVLPAWATIAIALGGSLIGALAGVVGSYLHLRATHLDLAHQGQEAWRSRLIEAAQGFSEAATPLGILLGGAVDRREPLSDEDDELGKNLHEEMEKRAILVFLVFGEQSAVGKAAAATKVRLSKCKSLLDKSEAESFDRANEVFKQANDSHDAFTHAAHKAIRSQ